LHKAAGVIHSISRHYAVAEALRAPSAAAYLMNADTQNRSMICPSLFHPQHALHTGPRGKVSLHTIGHRGRPAHVNDTEIWGPCRLCEMNPNAAAVALPQQLHHRPNSSDVDRGRADPDAWVCRLNWICNISAGARH
jgi:hypothetical protein